MRRVCRRECGFSGDIAREAVRTMYWDMQVRVTTRTNYMSRMGSTRQGANCDLSICETSKGDGARKMVYVMNRGPITVQKPDPR
jgi:hypothetical protein